MSVAKAMTALDLPMGEEPEIEVEIVPDPVADVEMSPDGGAVITFGAEKPGMGTPAFDDDLSEYMDEADLQEIATNLLEDYEADLRSRSDWERTYTRGLDLLGLKFEDRTEPWPGASGVFHPLLTEAVVRFQAQAIMEIFPASGPVKTQILGKLTPEKEKQANRVKDDMNYLLTEKMTEYRAETERLLFNLPVAGSCMRKIFFDPIRRRPAAITVTAPDFVVAYGATDLQSCPRYTHRMRVPANEVKKLQVVGFYREVDLPTPVAEMSDIDEKQDEISGEVASIESDDRHQILEMHVDYDMPGFEDDEGIALPYVVTIEKQSATILSIRRNWREDDKMKLKRMHFVKYGYLPGFGFYDLGLIQLIGGLAKSATSIMRQLIDAGTLANLPGGLKSRGLRIKGDDSPIMPGEFRDVDIPGGTIRDNITFLPYKEPSTVLYQLLGNVVDEGRRIGSIADLEIGDAQQQAPVGTTLALMERAMKVMSAVQARLHASMRQEFRLLVDLVRDHMSARYDYELPDGEDPSIKAKDYDDRVDVIPVSDPNASTMSQRVVQYQAALQLAASKPEIYDMPLLHRQMLEVLGIRDGDQIIPVTKEMKPADPVSENMALITGKPVKAFLYQDHEAHIAIHMAAIQDPKIMSIMQQSPNAQSVMAAAAAHIQEHLAFQYRKELEKQLGTELPPPDKALPEDVEVELSRVVAMAAEKLSQKNKSEAQAQQAQQQAQDPIVQIQQAELQLDAQRLQLDAKEHEDKMALENRKLQVKESLEQQRLAATAKVAGAQIGAKLAESKANISSRERTAGAQIGVQVGKNNQPQQMPPGMPPRRPDGSNDA